MFEISNVEFLLLSLIHEQQKVTGYHLNTLIDERGYREWADIGTTSIYTGLKKLKEKGHVTSATDRYKTGRGPKGVKYALTESGVALLKSETEQGLAKSRERGGRFMLALSALPVLKTEVALTALEQRIDYLQKESARIQAIYEQQQAAMHFYAELLFRYTSEHIRNEITITENLLESLRQYAENE
jgi:DNA-binding PadR family transcriptional regulator